MAEPRALFVEFFTEAVQDPKASKAAGRPIYKDRELVRIKIPGDQKREIVSLANSKSLLSPGGGGHLTYIERFPDHYEAFKKGEEQAKIGTPLEELTFLTAAKRAELKAVGITTAEMLAGLGDREARKMGMGTRELAEQARTYIAKAESNADSASMAAEIAKLKDQLAAMTGAASPEAGPSPFADMDADTLKVVIKDMTGTTPKGNPSRETLLRLAEEAAKEREAEAA